MSFGHYVRVLVDMDLAEELRYRVLVESKGYTFFIDLEYENLLEFCAHYNIHGHHIDKCNKKRGMNKHIQEKDQPRRNYLVVVRKKYLQKHKEPEVVNLEGNSVQKVDQRRTQADMELEKEVNEELEANHASLQATKNRATNYGDGRNLTEDAQSSSSSEFMDAAQTHEVNSNVDTTDSIKLDGTKTPNAVIIDMNFLKESLENLEDTCEVVYMVRYLVCKRPGFERVLTRNLFGYLVCKRPGCDRKTRVIT